MKLISLRDGKQYKSHAILVQVAAMSPNRPINPAEMRTRCRILDALDKAVGHDSLTLEDAEHATLRQAVNEFPFNVAHSELLAIIDDVNDAKEPPPPASEAPEAPAAA